MVLQARLLLKQGSFKARIWLNKTRPWINANVMYYHILQVKELDPCWQAGHGRARRELSVCSLTSLGACLQIYVKAVLG